MIQNSKLLMDWRWLESNPANEQPVVGIPKQNAHVIDLGWTEDKQLTLKALVERYSSQGASGALRVHQWWLACFLLVWETQRFAMTFLDNCTMNGHSIIWLIRQFSDG